MGVKMKTKLFLIIVLSFLFAIPVYCLGKDKDNVVTLEMIDQSLKDAEGSSIDAFVLEENLIEFKQTKVEKYDTFFREVAVVAGTVTELRFILTQINEEKITTSDAQSVIEFGKTALPALMERIPSLVEQVKSFTPSDDFTGLKKGKIPGVTKGLTEALGTLTSTLGEIPEIIEQIDALVVPDESIE